jgi:hypothetical protein
MYSGVRDRTTAVVSCTDMSALLTLSFREVSLTRNQMFRVSPKGRLLMLRAVCITTFRAR